MNIIRKTKWALLDLFPGQKETEAAAEEAAWNKALTAEAAAQAEVEAQKKEQAEGETPPPKEKPDTAIDQIEAEMAAIDLAGKGETTPEPPPVYDPETHDLPVSEIPEGPRPDGVLVVNYTARGVHLDVQCSPAQIVETARLLDRTGFCLESVSGIDWIKEEQMEVVYDYNRTDGQFCRVAVRVRIPRSEPVVPTVSDIFPGANWHERETHEFFGIKFDGHPYLVPLLLPEDADFHPLLKDFTP